MAVHNASERLSFLIHCHEPLSPMGSCAVSFGNEVAKYPFNQKGYPIHTACDEPMHSLSPDYEVPFHLVL